MTKAKYTYNITSLSSLLTKNVYGSTAKTKSKALVQTMSMLQIMPFIDIFFYKKILRERETDPGMLHLSLEISKWRCPGLFAYPDAISSGTKLVLQSGLLVKS
jgi:hypothetical protein